MLKIDNAKADKVGDATRRRITESYTLENNYRVKISTWHDKARKAYLTNVSECQVQPRDGYTMELHAMYSDFNQTVSGERTSRYSWRDMERAHNIAAESVEDLVRELIAKGFTREIKAA